MTKEQLRQYTDLKRESEHLDAILKRLENEEPAPRTSKLDGMPHGSSGENYVQEDKMDREKEVRQLYHEKKAQLDAQLLEIENAIEVLESTERELIRLRYLEGLKWEEVAVEIGYSWQQTHRIHARALVKLRAAEL